MSGCHSLYMQSTISDVGRGVDIARVADNCGLRDSHECLLGHIPDHHIIISMLYLRCQVFVIYHAGIVDGHEEVLIRVVLDGAVEVSPVLVRAHLPVGCVDLGVLRDKDVLKRTGVGGEVVTEHRTIETEVVVFLNVLLGCAGHSVVVLVDTHRVKHRVLGFHDTCEVVSRGILLHGLKSVKFA